ncbi:helix-turn-helix domain-containing protein [Mycetocola spongiae]|uniref:helix-turn-helix domain-containing protein n=1 Tax=Mycetocola spongiae TaxID=2859226 RepID=UPI001CF17F87|nr:helix-turn-helix transcriptional regulator [Mycetocola spongiae]UCR89164.1 helix-turn-helix transcriptional regulator [Mycetocola spongiae]
MPLTREQLLARRPVESERIEAHKERMLGEVRSYRLRELREAAGLTQSDLAERIGVGQRQISKIERGDLDNTKIGTIRKYLAAVGGDLSMEYIIGERRLHLV